MDGIPSGVTIGGHRFKVVWVETEDLEGTWGQLELDTRKILLSKRHKTTKQAMVTLRHEMIHAALQVGGVSYLLTEELEEGIVRCLEGLLLPALDALVPTK